MSEGLHNGEIATRLALSRATVATHVTKILKKLGCTSRVQVAVRVTEMQLAGRPGSEAGTRTALGGQDASEIVTGTIDG